MMKLIIFILSFLPSVAFAGNITLSKDTYGWTIFVPSVDSRIIYVSSSGDNNSCTYYAPGNALIGSDPFNPVGAIVSCSTYLKASTMVREDYPDWILFKRGDTFVISESDTVNGTSAIVPTSGRSSTEPSLIGAYGSSGASPLIKVTSEIQVAYEIHRTTPNWIALAGIDFYSFTRNPLDPGYTGTYGDTQTGLDIGGVGATTSERYNGFLIEGCKFRYFDESSIITTPSPIDGIILRRNLFSDSYAGSGQGHSQGLFTQNQNLTLEENIFIHNGWSTTLNATIFNHNVYNSSPMGATYTNNIFIQSSNMNNKFTADEYLSQAKSNDYPFTITGNLYIDGQQGIGWGNNTEENTYPFKNITIRNNVFSNIGKSNHLQGIAYGVDLGFDAEDVIISSNLVLNQNEAAVNNGNFVFSLAGIQTDVTVEDNISYNYKNGRWLYGTTFGAQYSTGSTKTNINFRNNKHQTPVNADYFVDTNSVGGYTFSGNKYYGDKSASAQFKVGATDYSLAGWQAISGDNSTFEQVAFPDSTRSIETYMASLGETNTIDAFIAKCRLQDRYSWDVPYTAPVVNQWIKAGFGMGGTRYKLKSITRDQQ